MKVHLGKVHLTEPNIVENFTRRFGCPLTVMENGEHRFHTQEQLKVLDK